MSTLKFGDDEPKQSLNRSNRAISAPAALRNRKIIADALGSYLPEKGNILELASGTGEHISLFAERFLRLTWQPSEMDPSRIDSITAYGLKKSLPNLKPPLHLDVVETDWHSMQADAIIAINLLHVAPESVSDAVFRGASSVLRPNGVLILYGPFTRNGLFNAESNEQFHNYLREQDPAWGLRDIAQLDRFAEVAGLGNAILQDMPANNYIAAFRKN